VIIVIIGLTVAILGALMWADNIKKRKAREAAKDDQSDNERA
jgi:hypothetical protein